MAAGGVRRFACTACGACCTRGPEMELGEATPLADTFVLLLMVRVPSLPLAPTARSSNRPALHSRQLAAVKSAQRFPWRAHRRRRKSPPDDRPPIGRP